jgi:hypothetical protein
LAACPEINWNTYSIIFYKLMLKNKKIPPTGFPRLMNL